MTRRSVAHIRPPGWLRALLAPLALLPLASAARAHIVGNPVELSVAGASAPFGKTGAVAYTALGATHARALLASDSAGVAIISLSSFATLGVYTSVDSPGFASVAAARDDAHLFAGSASDDAVHVVSIANPATPVLVTKITPAQGAFGAPADLLVDCDVLYMCDAESPLIQVYDVADPAHPAFLRTITTPETRGIRALSVTNGMLVVPGRDGPTLADGHGAVFLYDVSAIEASPPALVAMITTPDETASAVLNAQRTRLLVTQRTLGGAVDLYDVMNPQAPIHLSTVTAGDYGINAYTPLRCSLIRQIAFVAWTQSGLQALDLDQIDAQNLVQPVGYYDTSNESPFNGVTGAIEAIPSADPDVILIADSREGLVAVRADPVYPVLPCLADCDDDHDVDVFDFAIFSSHFAGCPVTPFTNGDVDGDGRVNVFDFGIFAANFGCD